MTLRHGFKSEANWYARQMRKSMGISPQDPLCPRELADYLEVPLYSLGQFKRIATPSVNYLRSAVGRKEFSAVTLFYGRARMIIFNDAHSFKRQNSDISHELAHGILHYVPQPLLNSLGARHFDQSMEEEANWLGPALLVSDEAAIAIVEKNIPITQASDRYGATKQVVQMRINVCGALARVARKRAA